MSEFESYIPQEESPEEPAWHVVGDVKVYRIFLRDVEPRDVETLTLTPESIMHVTRHLASLSPDVRERMRGARMKDGETERVVDDAFIDAQLASAGSKFNEKITDPTAMIAFAARRLVEHLRAGGKVSWFENPRTRERTCQLSITVTPRQKAELGIALGEPLGTTRVIPITPELAPRVREEQRGKGEAADRVVVNVIEGVEAPSTDQLIISLRQKSPTSKIEFYTTYTGIESPAIPRQDTQTEEEYAYNREWWDRHAFVK